MKLDIYNVSMHNFKFQCKVTANEGDFTISRFRRPEQRPYFTYFTFINMPANKAHTIYKHLQIFVKDSLLVVQK